MVQIWVGIFVRNKVFTELCLFIILYTIQNKLKPLLFLSRYMVASDDIKAGEIIYTEIPIVVGPNPVSTPQCLFCYKKV